MEICVRIKMYRLLISQQNVSKRRHWSEQDLNELLFFLRCFVNYIYQLTNDFVQTKRLPWISVTVGGPKD